MTPYQEQLSSASQNYSVTYRAAKAAFIAFGGHSHDHGLFQCAVDAAEAFLAAREHLVKVLQEDPGGHPPTPT